MDPADTDEQAVAGTSSPDGDSNRLCHRVVRQATGPDRHTVFPTVVAENRRLTTWLTVDVDGVVDLESAR